MNPVSIGEDGIISKLTKVCLCMNRRTTDSELLRITMGIWDSEYQLFSCSYFSMAVEEMTANTFLPLIQQVCRHNAIIWSEKRKTYNEIYEY